MSPVDVKWTFQIPDFLVHQNWPMANSRPDAANKLSSLQESTHPMVDLLRKDLCETWRTDKKLVEKFFPCEPQSHSAYLKAREELYNDNAAHKRWKGILATPKSRSKLYTPLTILLNRILVHYGISRRKRLFINSHIRCRNPEEISPGIFLAGVGRDFTNTDAVVPRVDFASCMSALEVMLESDSQDRARDLLAVHMYRAFQFQDNRRFVFGMIITQQTFTLFMFDHSGVVASEPCDYHANPEQFCSVISGLAGEGQHIGFDTTMVREGEDVKFSTFEPRGDDLKLIEAHYFIDKPLFRYGSLVSRGTLCWLVAPEEDREQDYVIKDSWIPESELEGRESEASLLWYAQHKGVTKGIAQIRHEEKVRRSADPSDFDTILRNRQADSSSSQEKLVDRVHTRIVMEPFGKPLDQFSTRRELILAFLDSVIGHRDLHQQAGILHRDISVLNILILPPYIEECRGALIDLDHSIRVGDTSPYSTKQKIGTWRYMSRNVLESVGPHTYLDDLESFYYVLLWIVAAYREPRAVKSQLPNFLIFWDMPDAPMMKRGQISSKPKIPVNPWFGACFRVLMSQLSHFFFTRRHLIGRPLSSLDPNKDYEEYIGLIRQCIADMEAEDLDNIAGKSLERTAWSDDSSSEESSSEVAMAPAPKPPKRAVTLYAKQYPRRSTANYGHL